MLQTEPPGQNQPVYAESCRHWDSIRNEESIGKAVSSPGIRSNKNTHINCGSSARMAAHLPASARSCSRRSANDMTDWRRKNSALTILFNLPNADDTDQIRVIMMFRKTFIQDSVLKMELQPCYPIWQHSIFSDPAYLSFKRDMLQIEAQEHDPAHTLLQQCVPMHSRFQAPI
ncbi:hypothetical protein [Absidia glauca]|uniref:Ndc10 domain-containing protein n=1 Tax=Absidia glauca TaxID=4829 RepID=A0A168PYE7_ABSGL|nr:hypothetical protein [Absidia glauca]